eukprot:561737-Pelagomonas_calceolata.AAC.2
MLYESKLETHRLLALERWLNCRTSGYRLAVGDYLKQGGLRVDHLEQASSAQEGKHRGQKGCSRVVH